jgi:hypothetical protein
MPAKSLPPAPKGTGPTGRKLWRAVLAAWELDEHELALLVELTRVVDRLANLDEIIRRDGEIIAGLHGPKVHPALTEARQLAVVQARLQAVLRLPDGEEGDESQGRRQRRSGARGTYRLRDAG